MGLMDLFKTPDINEGIAEWKKTQDAVLIDVRSAEEYREGHIPGSISVPVQDLGKAGLVVPDEDTPVFTYCLSGARSSRAAEELKRRGYSSVKNIGGINKYAGKIER